MKNVYHELFRTRVAQRMMGLFLVCAMVPILALGITSYIHVSGQLEDQARQRLQLSSKDAGLAVMERLRFQELELKRLARTIQRRGNVVDEVVLGAVPPVGIRGAAVVRADRSRQVILADLASIPSHLTEKQQDHLRQGKAILVARGQPFPDVYLAQAIDSANLSGGILWAALDPGYLWSEDADRRRLPDGVEMCVYAGEGVVLSCPHLTKAYSATATNDPAMASAWSWEVAGQSYLAATGTLFLAYEYAAPAWTVVLGEPRAQAMAPLEDFRQSFPLVLLLTLMIVLGISHVQVRRSMEPLRALTDATSSIALQDFDTTVTVNSGDEFQDLAGSFNGMARRLGRQFATLTAMSDIDRVALSHGDRDAVVRTVLTRAREVLPCQDVALLLRDGSEEASAWRVVRMEDGHWNEASVDPHPDELAELKTAGPVLEIPKGRRRNCLSPWRDCEVHPALYPLVRADLLVGALILIHATPEDQPESDQRAARQLADQVTVALANASLLEDLDALSSGALTALARTIDANSPWTAGHSERVTTVAVALGRRLGLADTEIETLYRGGLLHDIGKIATPASILNKPGALTEEEFAIIKLHPATGARILSPIKAYSDTIPIVMWHHERLDGSGYPEGLIGDAIPLAARIMAVADVYDALTSPRPYRPGWMVERVLEHLTGDADVKFDAAVTEAMVDVVGAGILDQQPATVETGLLPVTTAGPALPFICKTPA